MVSGEVIARIISSMAALLEAMLGAYVNVTNVSGNVTPSLLPSGEDCVGYLSDLVEAVLTVMANMMSYLR